MPHHEPAFTSCIVGWIDLEKICAASASEAQYRVESFIPAEAAPWPSGS